MGYGCNAYSIGLVKHVLIITIELVGILLLFVIKLIAPLHTVKDVFRETSFAVFILEMTALKRMEN